ncbi:MAG: cell division protein FtsW [Candidatus Deianiraeaceae bacterium]|jgi:cell division protein FtsW
MLSRYNPLYLWWRDIHKLTLFAYCSLLFIGLMSVFSASYNASSSLGVENLYFFKKQVVFILIAFCMFFWLSCQSTEFIIKFAQIGLICSLLSLLAVFAMSGKSVKGAERWLNLRIITIQPSEILKPFFIVISAYLYYFYEKTRHCLFPILYGLLFLCIIFLLLLQPDFGMVLTYTFLTIILVLMSDVRFKTLVYIAIPVITILIIAMFSLSHVKYRIVHFFQGEKGYQTHIAYNAIKNGGLLGKGLGVGEISKKIPDSHNDFIFARIGEEMGGIFLIIIVMIFAMLIFSNLTYVQKEYNAYAEISFIDHPRFEKYQMSTIVDSYIIILSMAMIFFEAMVNVSVNLNLIPPKGMVLPFISYGGSSMLAHGILMGFVCAANRKKYHFLSINQIHLIA